MGRELRGGRRLTSPSPSLSPSLKRHLLQDAQYAEPLLRGERGSRLTRLRLQGELLVQCDEPPLGERRSRQTPCPTAWRQERWHDGCEPAWGWLWERSRCQAWGWPLGRSRPHAWGLPWGTFRHQPAPGSARRHPGAPDPSGPTSSTGSGCLRGAAGRMGRAEVAAAHMEGPGAGAEGRRRRGASRRDPPGTAGAAPPVRQQQRRPPQTPVPRQACREKARRRRCSRERPLLVAAQPGASSLPDGCGAVQQG